MNCQKCDFQEGIKRSGLLLEEVDQCHNGKFWMENTKKLDNMVSEMKNIKRVSTLVYVIFFLLSTFFLLFGVDFLWGLSLTFGTTFFFITPAVGGRLAKKELMKINGRPFFVKEDDDLTIECLLSDTFSGGSYFTKGRYMSVTRDGTFHTTYF